MKRCCTFLAVVISHLALSAAVLPPGSTVAGKTAGEWTVDAWKWIYSQSTNASSILDETGEFATNGQPAGLVFFVPQQNGITPEPVERQFTVPENKYLLVPILPLTIDNINTEPPLTSDGQVAVLNYYLGLATNLSAKIDDTEVPDAILHRARSPVFSLFFPTADNSLSVSYKTEVVGLVEPVIADGFWFLMEPLSTGVHVIETRGEIPGVFHHKSKARITVVPVTARQWINDLLVVVDDVSQDRARRVLRANLWRARSHLSNGDKRQAITELRAFKKSVDKHLRPSDNQTADQLSASVDKLIAKLRAARS